MVKSHLQLVVWNRTPIIMQLVIQIFKGCCHLLGKYLPELDMLCHHLVDQNGITVDLDHQKDQQVYRVTQREVEKRLISSKLRLTRNPLPGPLPMISLLSSHSHDHDSHDHTISTNNRFVSRFV